MVGTSILGSWNGHCWPKSKMGPSKNADKLPCGKPTVVEKSSDILGVPIKTPFIIEIYDMIIIGMSDLLVVWNIFFPYIGNNTPIWLIFFKMVKTSNQYIYIYIFNIGFLSQPCSTSKLRHPTWAAVAVAMSRQHPMWSMHLPIRCSWAGWSRCTALRRSHLVLWDREDSRTHILYKWDNKPLRTYISSRL